MIYSNQPTHHILRQLRVIVPFVAVALLSGCSVWMEVHRPAPVNPHQFVVGESRSDIVIRLGNPVSTVPGPSGESCDVYRLHTKGLNGAEKIGIAIGEGAADVATWGLSEILFTPVESATENKKQPVVFCYKSAKLVSVKVE